MKQNLDKCINDISLPRLAALKNLLDRCHFNPLSEVLAMPEAVGRVLSEELVSQNTLPNTLTAERDGVAVYYRDFADGMPDTTNWVEGENYVFANTGIGINGDFDTEILIEKVFFDEAGHIRFKKVPSFKGEDTTPVGKEMKIGDSLGKAGQTLTPRLLAQLAKGGHTTFPVVKKPVVAFIPTGSELTPAGEPLAKGKNVDSNSVLVHAKLIEWGAEPLIYPICLDEPNIVRQALEDALKKADIILVNGGSSKGTDDVNHEVLGEIGEVLNHQVDTGPGKHTSYTMAGSTPIIGLSGPSVCCDYTTEWYVKPVIDQFLGREQTLFPTIKARSVMDLAGPPMNMTFMMGAHLTRDAKDEFVVIPDRMIPNEMRNKENCINCFIPLPNGLLIKAGEMVEVELRYPFTFPSQEAEQYLSES